MEKTKLNAVIQNAIEEGVREGSGSAIPIDFFEAWAAYEKGETIVSLHTGNEYQKDLEYYDDPDSETGKSLDVEAWIIPDEIRRPWVIKDLKAMLNSEGSRD
ncbi:hypothetical protein ABES02_28520 [Neobacillus pocheonensis]|uniref:hypothetical protein n=1 Tax=Neobacillus pocheonensis TaxID=363869 RepID=UPI003D2813B0